VSAARRAPERAVRRLHTVATPLTPVEVSLSYLSCPRCALSIRVRASWLVMERCPRCLARHGAVVELEEHATPPRLRPGSGLGRVAPAEAAEAARSR
jgi:hypothetical protein